MLNNGYKEKNGNATFFNIKIKTQKLPKMDMIWVTSMMLTSLSCLRLGYNVYRLQDQLTKKIKNKKRRRRSHLCESFFKSSTHKSLTKQLEFLALDLFWRFLILYTSLWLVATVHLLQWVLYLL